MDSRSLLMMFARLSPRTMLALILGLSAGVTWYVSNELNSHKQAPVPVVAQAPKQMTTVVVCTRNLDDGATVSAEDIKVEEVDLSRAPVDALSSAEAVIGRTLKFPLVAGTLISSHDLAAFQEKGFQAKLRGGERAVTFAVDNTTGVAGFVAPDSYVDVMVQVGSGQDSKTQAILSDVRVVASGTTYQKVPGHSEAIPTSNVTVAVQPKEAAKLINAMAAGKIYLTLRSDRDHTPVAVGDLHTLFPRPQVQPSEPTLATALRLPEPPKPPEFNIEAPPAPQAHEIEVYTGTNRNVLPVREL